jgi:hypothetical protein
MRGFSNKFSDFPDYIIGITKEIWEDRGIATLHDYYAPDIIVRSPSSVVVGNQNVIGATMATLANSPIAPYLARMSFGLARPRKACSARTVCIQRRPTQIRVFMAHPQAKTCIIASLQIATQKITKSMMNG